MKYLTYLTLAVVLFSACSKDDDPAPEPTPTPGGSSGTNPITGSAWVTVDADFDEQVYDMATYDNSLWLVYSDFSSGTTQFSYTGTYSGTSVSSRFQTAIGSGTGFDELFVYNDGFFARGALGPYGVFEYSKTANRWEPKYQSPGSFVNVYAFTQYNGNGVLAASDAPYVYIDNGGVLAGVGSGTDDLVRTLLEYNGDLIAAGEFTNAGGTSANYIARWNGSAWQPLGTGTNGAIEHLIEYDGKLIAAGDFTTAGGQSANHIAAWNGTAWEPLGAGIQSQSFNAAINDMTVHGNELFVGGDFSGAGTVTTDHIAKWDGSTWSALGGGAPDAVGAVAVYNEQLYIVDAYSFTPNILLRLE